MPNISAQNENVLEKHSDFLWSWEWVFGLGGGKALNQKTTKKGLLSF